MEKRRKATGIIVEYNPFHNGHIYHINQAKKHTPDNIIIAVMSPNFVQRGEPALVNKWERTRACLEHGVDLVIELPTVYAIQSATYFAKASVEMLALMHIETLVFGSETADMDSLQTNNTYTHDPSQSYAKNANNTKAANDILGSLYTQFAAEKKIAVQPILRTNAYHATDIDQAIASASAIRANLGHTDVHHTTPMDLETMTHHHLSDYEALIRYRLSLGPQYLKNLLMVDEGIENLLYKHRALPLDALIAACTNQKYSTTRIQRTLIAILLNLEKTDAKPLETVRVLGMGPEGQAYLRQLREDQCSPVVSFKYYPFKDLELKASEIYASVKAAPYPEQTRADELQAIIGIHEI